MKIISWNINNFCKEEDWEKLKNNNLLNKTKKKNKKDINNLIESYYREIENGGILILQEFPYGDNGKEADKFKLNLDGIQYSYPNDLKEFAYFSTVAIFNKDNWKKVEGKEGFIQIDSLINRVVVVTNGEINVMGVHMTDLNKRPDTVNLWNEVKQYIKVYSPDIIIGDFNSDCEENLQWKKLKEICNLGYGEPWGKSATRTKEHTPPTFIQGSHLDYALIKNKMECKAYDIDKKSTNGLSDHYSLVIEI